MRLGGAGREPEAIVTDRHPGPLLRMGRYEHVVGWESLPALPPGGDCPDHLDVSVRCPDRVAVHFPAAVMDDDLLAAAPHGTGSRRHVSAKLSHF
jgi:hypothetical protein